MKNPFLVLASTVIISAIIPIGISMAMYKDEPKLKTVNTTKGNLKIETKLKLEKKEEIENYERVDKISPIINVYNHKSKIVEKMDIEKYLCGVLAGEMSAEFNEEALKAQAIAARTYTIYSKDSKAHKDCDVCTNFKHCQEYKSKRELQRVNGILWINKYYPKIEQAVRDTKGQIMTYNNKPILPLYFSTSSGSTENSEEVFSTKYPYLRSVDSHYDKNAPKFSSCVKMSNLEFLQTLKKAYPSLTVSSKNLQKQINIKQRSVAGTVEKIKIGNIILKGRDIRSLFNLNSSNFDFNFYGNYINIFVKGYGHGVGMSQWGAQGMANDGYNCYDILKHYYSNINIKDIY